MLELTTWILLPPLFITIFWIIVILLNQYKKENKKWSLIFFLFCGMVTFVSSVALFGRYHKLYQTIYVPVVFFAMSQFPSFFVYIRTLTNEKGWLKSSLFHFVIPAITAGIAAYIHYILLSPEEDFRFFSHIITGDKPVIENLKFAYFIDRLSKNSFIVLGFVYYWLTNREVRKHREKINNYFSSTEEKNIAWIRFFNISFICTLAAGVFFHSMERKLFLDNTFLLAFTFVPLLIFFGGIGFFGNRQKDIYPTNTATESDTDDNANSLASDMQRLKERLKHTMDKEKLYLNPEISLPDLTKIIGTNRTYLSQLINQEFGLNFNQFINQYRIQEAKRMLEDTKNSEITIKEIGEKCGFATNQSFVRWFREYYEVTPGAFRKSGTDN